MCPVGQATIGTGGALTERTGITRMRTGGKGDALVQNNDERAVASSSTLPRVHGAGCDW